MCVCTPPKFKANLKAFLRKRRHPQARGFNFLEIHFNRWIFEGGGYHPSIHIIQIMENQKEKNIEHEMEAGVIKLGSKHSTYIVP